MSREALIPPKKIRPSKNKAIAQRPTNSSRTICYSKSFIGLVGVAAVNALTMMVMMTLPPVITINGDNPANVELAQLLLELLLDAYGSTNVTASGNVDTVRRFIYSHLYS